MGKAMECERHTHRYVTFPHSKHYKCEKPNFILIQSSDFKLETWKGKLL